MKWTLILTIFITYSAFGVKGEYVQHHDLSSTCKLTFFVKHEDKILTGTCTGSFIGNKTFITAEHCYDDVVTNQEKFKSQQLPEKSFFTCPGSEKKHVVKDFFPMKNSRLNELQDIALIKVEEDVEAKALALPKSHEEIEATLKNTENCYISGYGLDNDDKYGVLKTARVTNLENNPRDIFSVGSSQRVRLRENYADHGDSGGPLYCETPNGTVLIGVVHGGVKGVKFGDIEKVNAALEWIAYHRDHPDSKEELFHQLMVTTDMCHSLLECSEAMKNISLLTSDTDEIMKKLMKQTEDQRTEVLYGNEKSVVKLKDLWDEMLKEWQRNDCYKKLYPSSSD
jgi:hypothetical protein